MNEAYREAAAQLEKDIRYLAKAAGLKPGATMVLGCSTSEVAGGHIGKNSVPELGDALAETMIAVCGELGLHPVFQCCEHLNRALVMEQALLDRLNPVSYTHLLTLTGGEGEESTLAIEGSPAVYGNLMIIGTTGKDAGGVYCIKIE